MQAEPEQHMSFCDRLTSLRVVSSGSVRIVTCVRISSLFQAEQYSIFWAHGILLIHSPPDGHLGCFPLLAIVGSAVLLSMQILFCLRGFWGSDRGRRSQGSWRFGFPRPAAQPHKDVPQLPEAQDSSCIKGSYLTRPPAPRLRCWHLQDYGPWCPVLELRPHKGAPH